MTQKQKVQERRREVLETLGWAGALSAQDLADLLGEPVGYIYSDLRALRPKVSIVRRVRLTPKARPAKLWDIAERA